ncbi:FMN-dependent NADH-azoreductase [Pedobacter sp. 22163]|uniref:FMN-dependent NADH-azoreductase n=1 Tax=Pedobacter sp. 22163 TaxID=3453883 RepID=UPI003F864C8E
MSNILQIISSPRGGASNSIKLSEAIIDRLKLNYPSATLHIKDLTKAPFPHLEEVHLNAFFTDVEKHTGEHREAIKHSNSAIEELNWADFVVIGAPMYNFGVSSTLKAWFDHITRAGITFKYTDKGPIGLLSGKKVFLAVTTGGIYSLGEEIKKDFLTPYLKFMLTFIGMNDITVCRAEGFALSETRDTALEKAIGSIKI